MVAETTFLVRIFVYGLVGLVQGSPETTALLPVEGGHVAFVAFDKEGISTCTPPCQVTIGTKTLNGFSLAGDEISWTVNEDRGRKHVRQPRIPSIPPGRRYPMPLHFGKDHVDSTAFDWVAPMEKIAGSGEVDPTCLDPKNPNTAGCSKLAGRLKIDTGVLSTCRLIEYLMKNQKPGQGTVHSFDFTPPVKGVPQHGQALAEIVESEVEVKPGKVTVTLTPFGGAERAKAVLEPKPCKGRENAYCVDIFVGNILTGEKQNQETGDHFKGLYRLLKRKPNQKELPFPHRNRGTKIDSSLVEPLCRAVPPPYYVTEAELKDGPRPLAKKERQLATALDLHLSYLYPHQLVICPMGSFTKSP
ncbi:MAG TPA: hypothetical protein VHR45_21655 [Thermoanaerobaculia bacterium]|nr:hypothetical protein [Thermoanaerobaculia bacterium]